MTALIVAARFAQFFGAAVVFGAPLFGLYGGGRPGRRLLAAAVGLVLLGGAVALVAQTAAMAGDAASARDPQMVWAVLSGTQFGHGLGARLAATLLALIGLALRPGRARDLAFSGLGAAIMASFAWTGHGAADDGLGGLVHVAADVLHLLAAGVWIGALVGLLLIAGRTRDAADLTGLHTALASFSGVGSAVVAALVLTGLVNSWFLVGPSRILALGTSPYGLLLLAKLVLFAAMLGLAALNRFRLTPALAAGMRGAPDPAVAALRRSLVLETAAGAAVLALVAAMGAIAPLSAQ